MLIWRSRWIVLGGVVGMAIGWAAARTVTPVYQSVATLAFENARADVVQVAVVSASVEAVVRNQDFASNVAQSAGVRIRRMWARPADVNSVALYVQAYGDAAQVRAATQAAAKGVASGLDDDGFDKARALFASLSGIPAERWQLLLSTADAVFRVGLDTGRRQGRIDQHVIDHVPAPIVTTARPWYDAPVKVVGEPSPPVLMRQRFLLAGLFIGIGLAILLVALHVAFSRLRSELVDPLWPQRRSATEPS